MREDLEQLGERIAEHAAHLDAAMHRLLTDIRTFDEGGGWYHQGCRSCAHWLSWRVGLGRGAAREHVRVARRLGELPLIDDALRTGSVSYSKVRAITRVATPANEATLLADAQMTPAAQLETICRKYAFVQRHDANVSATDEDGRRYVRQHDTEDGMVRIVAVLHPEEAAIVWAALERVATERLRMQREPVAEELPANASGEDGSHDAAARTPSDVDAGPTEHDAVAESPSPHVPAGTPVDSAPGLLDRTAVSESASQDVPAGTPLDRHAVPAADDMAAESSSPHVPAGTSLDSARGVIDHAAVSESASPHVPAGTHRDRDALLGSDDDTAVGTAVDSSVGIAQGAAVSESASKHVPAGTPRDRDARLAADDDTAAESSSSHVPAGTSLDSARRVVDHAAVSESASQRVPAGTPRVRAFDRAEALVAIAQEIVRGTSKDRSPIEVVVTVTRDALHDVAPDPIDQVARLPDGGCISIEAARRLCCDAGIVQITEDEHGTPLSVGRKTRSIPAAIKRALLRRDKTCRFPGCTNRVFLEGHHITHWLDGGETSLRNILSMCSHHHHFVHEYKYRIELTADGPRFFDDRGRLVPDVPPPVRVENLGWSAILERNAHLSITAETGACSWDGDPIDYRMVIDDLCVADGGH